MQSILKPDDPFNLNDCIGVHARTLFERNIAYMLNRFLPDVFTVDSHDNQKIYDG